MPKPDLRLVSPAPAGNRILAALPPEEADKLEPHLETVALPLRLELYQAGKPVEHVYFLDRGVASCWRR